jgi:nucleoid-associated protein YgaU
MNMRIGLRTAACVIFAYAFSAVGAFGQSLQNNADYQKAKELQMMAEQAMQSGDYDAAYSYAEEARQYSEKAQEFASSLLVRFKADNWLSLAGQKLADAEGMDARKRYPKEYAKASDGYAQAQTTFKEGRFEDSIVHSKTVVNALADVTPPVFPQYYTVRLIPKNRDTLSKIAGYPWVYNDGTKWRVLYEANKKKLRYPNDPDWIYPGQVFVIPSLRGETREGTYDPKMAYPALTR